MHDPRSLESWHIKGTEESLHAQSGFLGFFDATWSEIGSSRRNAPLDKIPKCDHLNESRWSFCLLLLFIFSSVQFKETVSFFGWNPNVWPLLALSNEYVDEIQLSVGGHRYKIRLIFNAFMWRNIELQSILMFASNFIRSLNLIIKGIKDCRIFGNGWETSNYCAQ